MPPLLANTDGAYWFGNGAVMRHVRRPTLKTWPIFNGFDPDVVTVVRDVPF